MQVYKAYAKSKEKIEQSARFLYLYSDMRQDHDLCIIYVRSSTFCIIEDHISLDPRMVLIVECTKHLRSDIRRSSRDFYRSDEGILMIFCDECDICSGFLSIEIECMCVFKLAGELEKYEILCSVLFQCTFAMNIS